MSSIPVRSFARVAAAAVAFLAVPSTVLAQESLWPLQQEMEVEYEYLPMKASLLVAGRVSAIGGEVDPYVPVDYDDIFGTGYGLMLDGRLMWKLDEISWMGCYLSLGWDRYDGRRDTDYLGDSLEPDEMEMTTALVGARWVTMIHPRFYCEAHVGVGLVHYGDVDGTLVLGGVPENVKVFDATTRGAFDVGGRLGYTRRRFLAEIGFGIRLQGHPDDADLDFDSSTAVILALEAGVGFQF